MGKSDATSQSSVTASQHTAVGWGSQSPSSHTDSWVQDQDQEEALDAQSCFTPSDVTMANSRSPSVNESTEESHEKFLLLTSAGRVTRGHGTPGSPAAPCTFLDASLPFFPPGFFLGFWTLLAAALESAVATLPWLWSGGTSQRITTNQFETWWRHWQKSACWWTAAQTAWVSCDHCMRIFKESKESLRNLELSDQSKAPNWDLNPPAFPNWTDWLGNSLTWLEGIFFLVPEWGTTFPSLVSVLGLVLENAGRTIK